MDFDMANQYAKQILEGKNDQFRELVKMCLPYLYHLRKKFGFYSISLEEVNKLATDAVSDAIMDQRRRKLSFTICIRNSFRDTCRKKEKMVRKYDRKKIIHRCGLEEFKKVMCGGSEHPEPQVKAEERDLVELVNNILKNHDHFSKQVVYQKTRGSTYPEMADIFSTTLNECKRVYWHDITHIREKLNPKHDKKQKRI